MGKVQKWQWLVLLTSFAQIISPPILTILGLSVNGQNSGSTQAGSPQITPADYTFIVWGAITILAFAYGVYQVNPGRQNQKLHEILSQRLIIVYSLFALWLIAAILQWIVLTVLIFVTMFILLTRLFEKLIERRQYLNRIEKIILFGQIAIYTGWSAVAIFANTASAIKFYGLADEGVTGMIWQALILIFALLNSRYWLRKFDQNFVFGATVIWAFVGIFFGLIQYNNNTALRLITLFGILLVAGHLVINQIRLQLK